MKDTTELPKNVTDGKLEEDGRNFTIHTFELMTLKPIDIRLCKAEELQKRCEQYFFKCAEDDMKPSVAGFALAIGLDRRRLQDVVAGRIAIPNDNREVLNRYYTALNALMEDYVMNNKIQVVGGIFLLKNNFGYKDQQEVVFNGAQENNVSEDALLEEANLLLQGTQKKAQIDDDE